jgi:hypothetical protein
MLLTGILGWVKYCRPLVRLHPTDGMDCSYLAQLCARLW